jgi:hypothetical protein
MFTNQSIFTQNDINAKLSDNIQTFRIFENKSLILLNLKERACVKELNLDSNYIYLQDGEILTDDDFLLKGNNWINYRCVLKGGKPAINLREPKLNFLSFTHRWKN